MLRALLFLGLLTAAAPAAADVTGRYRGPDGQVLKLEVDESGIVRVGAEDQPTYTVYDRQDGYVVETEGDTIRVVKMSDLRAALDEMLERLMGEPPQPAEASSDEAGGLTAVGSATVGGRTGTAYRAPGENPPEGHSLVLSEDPRLAPLGLAWSRAMSAMPSGALFAGPAQTPEIRQLGRMLATQAPLQLGAIVLIDVSFEEIAEDRFQIPAVPMSRAEVAEMLETRSQAAE